MTKKTIYIVSGIAMLFMVIVGLSWLNVDTPNETPVTAVAPAAGPVPAVVPQPAPAQIVQAPVATPAPAVPAVAVQATQTMTQPKISPSPAPSTAPTQAPVVSGDDPQNKAMEQVIDEDFSKDIGFPLTEEKMQAFTRAALRVEKINDKWDVQIAGAKTDAMAIEYNNFAVEEVTKALATIPGLTLQEYEALTALTAKNDDFNKIFFAYKQAAKNETKNAVKLVTVPVNPTDSGTAPVPQGSPAPQGSQPPAR